MKDYKNFDDLTSSELRLIYADYLLVKKSNLQKDSLVLEMNRLKNIVEISVEKSINPVREILEDRIEKELKSILKVLRQMEMEKAHTIKEVANITGKHHKTIRNWIDLGDLKAYKLGKVWMVKHSDLEAFKNKRSGDNPYDNIFKIT